MFATLIPVNITVEQKLHWLFSGVMVVGKNTPEEKRLSFVVTFYSNERARRVSDNDPKVILGSDEFYVDEYYADYFFNKLKEKVKEAVEEYIKVETCSVDGPPREYNLTI